MCCKQELVIQCSTQGGGVLEQHAWWLGQQQDYKYQLIFVLCIGHIAAENAARPHSHAHT